MKGRKRKLTDQEALDVRESYCDPKRLPSGRHTSMVMLARLYGASEATIKHAVDQTGAYSHLKG